MRHSWCNYLIAVVLMLFSSREVFAEATIVFETGFETSEGYVEGQTLWGQQQWLGFGSGGNAIVNEFLEGMGQQGYVGFSPGDEADGFLNLYRPTPFAPLAEGLPIVRFSVVMSIVDSSNERYDDFRWSVYNTDEERLFSLDFDNNDLGINYLLDGSSGFESTGYSFDLNGVYDLTVTMNFASNRWSAKLNETDIVEDKPITTVGAKLTIGDIDAVWVTRNKAEPGDNYMLFDNFKIEADKESTGGNGVVAAIEILGFFEDDKALLRVRGEKRKSYQVEVSEDLVNWRPARSVSTSSEDGSIEFLDEEAGDVANRFYRLKP